MILAWLGVLWLFGKPDPPVIETTTRTFGMKGMTAAQVGQRLRDGFLVVGMTMKEATERLKAYADAVEESERADRIDQRRW